MICCQENPCSVQFISYKELIIVYDWGGGRDLLGHENIHFSNQNKVGEGYVIILPSRVRVW